jgi:hypothetical protein
VSIPKIKLNNGSPIYNALNGNSISLGFDEIVYQESLISGWYMGIQNPQYTIYTRSVVNPVQPNIWATSGTSDIEILNFINRTTNVGNTPFTSTTEAFYYVGTKSENFIIKGDYPNISLGELVLNYDTGMIMGYPWSGNTVYDLSPLQNNATLSGSPTFSPSYDGIIDFNGSGQYAYGSDIGQLTAFTINTWFRLESLPSSTEFPAIATEKFVSNNLGWCIGFANFPQDGKIVGGYYNNGWILTSGFTPTTNTWYNVTLTYDNTVLKLYIDGVLFSSVNSTTDAISSGLGFNIGKRWDTDDFIDGQIQVVQVYNKALSGLEILNGYNQYVGRYVSPVVSPTPTPSTTETPTVTPTNTPTETTTNTPTPTVTPTVTETPTETPTPTVTATSTETPTNTPTPSVTPEPVTGYSFNLVALPYNFPTSGNTIMNSEGGIITGSTNPNVLATGSRGLYWNSIDSDGVDRTSYFSQFTGESITITMTQTGSTAIYSGDTNSLKTWIAAGPGTGFVFGAGIGVPPSNIPSGTATLIQSASTQWTIGLPVYISVVVNVGVTPTPTNTNTPTPTNTPTNTNTPTPTPTNTTTPTPTPTPSSTPNAPVTSNLVLYYDPSNSSSYPGTGTTINDISGNGLSGTMSNITFTSPYFSFNGTSSQISVADNPLLEPGSGDWSIEFWVNHSVLAGSSRILIAKTDGGNSSDWGYGLRSSSVGNTFMEIGNGTSTVQSSSTGLTTDNWYQVVGVWTNVATNTFALYVNGNLIGSNSHSFTSVKNTTSPLYLGSFNGGQFSQWLNGKMGVVRLYQKALTDSEVLQNFNSDKSKYGL